MPFSFLEDVSSAGYDWTVKVRVVRKWRGTSNNGKEFKGFNLLLLDTRSCRLPAFVPAVLAHKYESKIVVGHIHVLSNFNVKDYKPDEKFRCVCCEKQIYFSNFTEVEHFVEDDIMIPRDIFDFADLGDLIDIAGDNTYLTDVIGVIQQDYPIRRFKNKNGVHQAQIKFEVTDGRCSHCVTFWDGLAEDFCRALITVNQFPAIVIVASAKITSWQKRVDISNVTATRFFLNYDHHSVVHLRQMLGSPSFAGIDFSSQMPESFEEHQISSINALGLEYLNVEVICELKVILIVQMEWYKGECSGCYREIDIVDGEYRCIICNRDVPFADKKFNVMAEAIDGKDSITISLNDRTVRTLIGKTVIELLEEGYTNEQVPPILHSLESKWYSAKIKISSQNIERSVTFFYVTDMFELNQVGSNPSPHTGVSIEEVSSSSIHLDGLEDLNFQSPELTKAMKIKAVLMS